MFRGYFKDVFNMFCGCFKDVFKMFYGCFNYMFENVSGMPSSNVIECHRMLAHVHADANELSLDHMRQICAYD